MARIERVTAHAYTVPTASHESDGTLEWDATTMIVVEAHAGGRIGLGISYNCAAAASVVRDELRSAVEGRDAMAVQACWHAMRSAVRNLGREGIGACAISAVDLALWDLKAKLLGMPLYVLLGPLRDSVALYGSGGFTSYGERALRRQLEQFVDDQLRRVKIKVGRHPDQDVERVSLARGIVGDGVELFVDANGAYDRKQAIAMAEAFDEFGVTWYEEPVSSDDLAGLRFVRERVPARVRVAAGEYGWDAFYFRRMLDAGAVDVLQADVTRCLGLTGLLQVAHECDARNIPLSFHCAPAMHLHAACVIARTIHLEWFFDHVRIERMLFDGPEIEDGCLSPDAGAPGHGIVFKHKDAERYAA